MRNSAIVVLLVVLQSASAFLYAVPASRHDLRVASRAAAPRLSAEAAAAADVVPEECEIIGEEIATETTWFTCDGDAAPAGNAGAREHGH